MSLLDKLPSIPEGHYVVQRTTGQRIDAAIDATIDISQGPHEACHDMFLVGLHIALTNPIEAKRMFEGSIDANYEGERNADQRAMIEAQRMLIVKSLAQYPDAVQDD